MTKQENTEEKEQVIDETANTKPETTEEASVEISREEELEQEVTSLKDKLLRNAAEFENFKKRTAKEKEELFSMGFCSAIEKLLLVKDNLERAIPTMDGADATAISDGVKMIDKQFQDILAELSVTPIPAVGEKFDPEKHNAVMHDENEDFGENTISEEFMKGYMFKEKVIRHSMVKVSN